MRVSPLLVLPLLWSMTLSQHTVPYLSFMGQTLANHSWVDISQVGISQVGIGHDLQCHTDLETCCSGRQGQHRGDWYFPNEGRLPTPGGGNIFEARIAQRVDLRIRNQVNEPTGIFCCDMPTIAVHHDTDTSVTASVYVGLYTSTGGIIS